MDSKKDPRSRSYRMRKGSTLAEFALTLPILLLIVFGTIEFGRLFQSWVTLQNSAREATRYATTGQYNEDVFNASASLNDVDGTPFAVEPILPCVAGDERGSLYTYTGSNGAGDVNVYAAAGSPPTATDYVPDRESLYALYYDGTDCDPNNPDNDNDRKDILRLASIVMSARKGAAGLSLNSDFLQNAASYLDEEEFKDLPIEQQRSILGLLLVENFETVKPDSETPRYFHVSICSSRGFRSGESLKGYNIEGSGDNSRFMWIKEDTTGFNDYPYLDAENRPVYEEPFCMLNEVNSQAPYSNAGIPWMDAGGAGDRVTLVVTYNHPLITPIGVAEYITMRARRSGVNESFRASRALDAVSGDPSGEQRIDTATPQPTNTPLPPTDTLTPTEGPSATPSPSPTPLPEAFTCDDLGVEFASSNAGYVYLNIFNYHLDFDVPEANMVELQGVELKWQTTGVYGNMFLQAEFLNGTELLWFGENNTGDFTASIDFNTNDLTQDETDDFIAAYRKVPPLGPPGDQEITQWQGIFQNGPNTLPGSIFAGTIFTFFDPVSGITCPVELAVVPTDPPDPQETIEPVDPTATFTPNCASNSISMRFVEFQDFGVVKLEVTSQRFELSPLNGFQVNWPDPASLDPDATGILKLDKIVIGGIDADDYGGPSSQGVLVWDGDDLAPSTTHNDPSTVFWRNNYNLPGQATLPIYLDFAGTGATLQQAFGIGDWMFNNTFFNFGCYRNGPGNGPGDSDEGPVFIATNTPPPATNTPRPTRTPGPTQTPSPTRPTATPRPTSTPGPPTNTPSPTNTEGPTRPPTRTPVPTDPDGGPPD